MRGVALCTVADGVPYREKGGGTKESRPRRDTARSPSSECRNAARYATCSPRCEHCPTNSPHSEYYAPHSRRAPSIMLNAPRALRAQSTPRPYSPHLLIATRVLASRQGPAVGAHVQRFTRSHKSLFMATSQRLLPPRRRLQRTQATNQATPNTQNTRKPVAANSWKAVVGREITHLSRLAALELIALKG